MNWHQESISFSSKTIQWTFLLAGGHYAWWHYTWHCPMNFVIHLTSSGVWLNDTYHTKDMNTPKAEEEVPLHMWPAESHYSKNTQIHHLAEKMDDTHIKLCPVSQLFLVWGLFFSTESRCGDGRKVLPKHGESFHGQMRGGCHHERLLAWTCSLVKVHWWHPPPIRTGSKSP